uniref:Uncharacterized protein n=1 Tax=Siphoviridae sp. ctGa111 TaxID=2825413 RepID=A0A8S5VDL5_9CAUD|nr:MAG TPA: hypothetical protein [Siphoviridae sp. ctGa111]DAM40152.1 MAG TPA: hypothetical protein [Caudoviricetes sp.]
MRCFLRHPVIHSYKRSVESWKITKSTYLTLKFRHITLNCLKGNRRRTLTHTLLEVLIELMVDRI